MLHEIVSFVQLGVYVTTYTIAVFTLFLIPMSIIMVPFLLIFRKRMVELNGEIASFFKGNK